MDYCGFMFVSHLLLFVILFIHYVYLFIGFATQPIVKLYACNAVRDFQQQMLSELLGTRC